MRIRRIACYATAAVLLLGLATTNIKIVHATNYPVVEVSTDQNGNPADRGAFGSQLSVDGIKVAFTTNTGNLDPHFSLPEQDTQYVYMKNLQTGQTQLVSVGTNGEVDTSEVGVAQFKLTPDAHYLEFTTGRDLYSPTHTGPGFVYVRDLQAGVTTQVNFDGSGNPIEGVQATMSDDGRYVGLASFPNGYNLYMRDTQTNTTTMLPVHGYNLTLSGNGQYLFYDNKDDGFVRYRYGLNDGSNLAVSVGDGAMPESTAASSVASSSYDGNRVVFAATKTLLDTTGHPCSQDPGQNTRLYMRDIAAGTTTRLDTNSDGSDPSVCDQMFSVPSISSDGTKVVFASSANFAGSPGNSNQVFMRDLVNSTVTGISLNVSGTYLSRGVFGATIAAISADGSWATYQSVSPDLPPNGGNLQIYATPTQVAPVVGAPVWASNPVNFGQDTTVSAPAAEVSGAGVVGGEYFVDTDPGAGSATPMSFDGNSLTATLGSTLASGTHTIGVRAVDAKGVWGLPTFTQLVVNPPFAAPVITSANAASTGIRANFDFKVTTTGFAYPTLSVSGVLPNGLSFTDNGDGTGDIKGIAAAGASGTYPLTVSAANNLGSDSQTFTLTITTATAAPSFVSASADTEEYGQPFSFTIVTTGYPVPTITKKGTLPGGVTFTNNGDGTATLAGTPSGSAGGVYPYSFTAKNGLSPNATQNFSLTITRAPLIKAITGTTATVGTPYSLTIGTRGYTTPSLSELGALPSGLSFVDNTDGTATIAGTPDTGTGGVYAITITATNQGGTTSKTFNLKVDEAPFLDSEATVNFATDTKNVFQMQATGYPKPTYSLAGSLPASITFNTATGKFSGKPTSADVGQYDVTVTATNIIGSASQLVHLIVFVPGPPS